MPPHRARGQEVLWYTEVEQMKPAEVAPLLGMKASAVSQLAFRAREGLRVAWIQAHIAAVGEGTECSWTIERLGAHERGNLGARDQGRLDRHVADCARCAVVVRLRSRAASTASSLVAGSSNSASSSTAVSRREPPHAAAVLRIAVKR